MSPVTRYALTFPGTPGTQAPQDVVVVERTSAAGPGGHPVYEDASGIVRAEISDAGEVRMLATGGHQNPHVPVHAQPLP
ncbi:DUF6296 family protein [Kitasatospora purpeofusca]|uniref:DUF6296 family protein n=1 Tax=Kitasatospora purpeofusca TaxID=67352 RepID=UPI000A93C883|nr:DUF6296 family protein [Kitasatospora purpeofusca]MCX4683644.1 DUF6296 family protein [Kitasatospora purpeofusca]MCX4759294.1 DUF6296 family protein [Kitasatospora purpeofusca]WSR30312.1 DUF6296 family protein [Kitasatospora purpeofusca]WSR38545.1 DUF6296 family protein [Kitasatospora purpeofusca]BEK63806.1 hypothetical protein KPHV_10330 [Kitasatospora purpeofusca]